MKLTLVRHTAVDCLPTLCYGQTDVDVAKSFQDEAEIVRLQLHSMQFDKVFSSPLQRCVKLAAYCGFENIQLDNRLMELNFGDWEGQKWDEISDPNLEKWYADWILMSTTNGESFTDQIHRVEQFLQELSTAKWKNVLIFTHAGVIRCFAILLGLVDLEKAFSHYSVKYGEIKEFELLQ